MIWEQVEFSLKPRARGFHLVTEDVISSVPQLNDVEVGLLHLLLLHTSASLTINENADPTVRQDFESFFNRTVPEDAPYFIHTYEGPDDMPAHLKASLLGTSLSLPISNGRLRMGTWQGIYLGEHRDAGGARRLLATVQGR
jgi:secondary thiamine-phosphate synthase enzyme